MRFFFLIVFAVTFLGSLFISESAFSQSLTKSYVPGEIIVKYKTPAADSGGKSFSSKAKAQAAQKSNSRIMAQKGFSVKTAWSDVGAFHYKIKDDQKVSDVILDLKNDPEVEYAEPNYYLQAATAVKETGIMSDEELQNYIDENYAPSQNEANALPYGQTGAPINIPETWALLSPTGAKPVVAVIDSGVDINHRSLKDAIWTNSGETPGNGIDDDGNGYIDDVNGWNFVSNNNDVSDCNDHGTHVAGIVRGSTQDVIPNMGGVYDGDITQSKLEIMPVKFLDCDGIGMTSDAVSAIYYAVRKGAKILNNSWGGGAYSTPLHQAIVYAYDNDTLFVAAAGNSGLNIDNTPTYPASYPVPNVIAVAATNSFDYLPYFSNYGLSSVHIAAPGVGITSSVPGGGHISMSGTSMAAPFIAGVAAMMNYEKPTMIGYQLKNILVGAIDQPFIDSNSNSVKDSNESYKLDNKVSNNGRMNSKVTVQTAQATSISSFSPSYNASSYDAAMRGPSSEAGGCGLVQKVYTDYEKHQSNPKNNGAQPFSVIITFLVLMIPMAVALTMRQNTKYQRRYERYFLGSQVQIQTGHKEYLGSVGTISLGGLSFSSNAILKLGNSLELNIANPAGSENLNVKGQIVWMSSNNSYGVKFQNIAEETLIKINEWSKGLNKA
ncbi:MAG: S8 family serine peptidase [Bdellovibrionota bacterium]